MCFGQVLQTADLWHAHLQVEPDFGQAEAAAHATECHKWVPVWVCQQLLIFSRMHAMHLMIFASETLCWRSHCMKSWTGHKRQINGRKGTFLHFEALYIQTQQAPVGTLKLKMTWGSLPVVGFMPHKHWLCYMTGVAENHVIMRTLITLPPVFYSTSCSKAWKRTLGFVALKWM